ncbi:MAG: hypothetical protein JST88_09175 [Bacteroidetes bacterium]|nr:hypothetical protein [Bacteroidota bacterium]
MDLKNDFIAWVEGKTGDKFTTHPFLLGTLDNCVEQLLRTFINEQRFIDLHPPEFVFQHLLSHWIHTSSMLLQSVANNSRITVNFRKNRVPEHPAEQEELLRLFDRLTSQCSK